MTGGVNFSNEVANIELVVPSVLIVSLLHRESLIVNTLIVPLALLAEQEHVLVDPVRADHIEVEDRVLLSPELPRGAPVVVLGNWNQVRDRDVQSLDAVHGQRVHSQHLSLWEQLHLQDEALWANGSFHVEGHKRVDKRGMRARADCGVPLWRDLLQS